MRIGKIRNGVILISVGIVLLLNNLGWVPWSVWVRILSLWPAILIAIGIEKIFAKTRLSFLSILSPLLFMAAILGPAFLQKGELGKTYHASEKYQYSKDLDTSVTEVTAIIKLKAGNLNISSCLLGLEDDKLVVTKLDYYKRKPLITYEYSDSDSSATVEIQDRERGWKGWTSIWEGWADKDWEIKLTPRIPINLRIYANAADGKLDFSDLKLKNLTLDIKATSFEIRLGNLVDQLDGRVESDACRLSLLIPEDMGLKIENHAKLTSTSFSDISILKYDNIYQTSNFDQTSKKITISLEGSVTRLVVKSYQKSESI
jgi:hypothetical protein